MRNTRDARAVERKTASGRQVAAGHWAVTEFDALCRAWAAGVPVPYPVQISGTEVVMEFIGGGRTAAPRLAQTWLCGAELDDAFTQVLDVLRTFARAGFAHGDRSPDDLLLHEGRVVVIDLPQIVLNVCTWFARDGVEHDPESVFGEVLTEAW